MGEFAVYIWSSYAIAAGIVSGLLVWVLREARIAAIEQDRLTVSRDDT